MPRTRPSATRLPRILVAFKLTTDARDALQAAATTAGKPFSAYLESLIRSHAGMPSLAMAEASAFAAKAAS